MGHSYGEGAGWDTAMVRGRGGTLIGCLRVAFVEYACLDG